MAGKRRKKSDGDIPWTTKEERAAEAAERLIESIKTAPEGTGEEIFRDSAASYLRLFGDSAAVRDVLADAAVGVLDILQTEDLLDEAARVATAPGIVEMRRLEAGHGLIRFVESYVQYDEETGAPVTGTTAEMVKARWPGMRYFENPATPDLEKRGVWLEVRNGRWHCLLTSFVELRVRRMLMAQMDGDRIESKGMLDGSRDALKDLHRMCLAGTTDQIDQSDHLLDCTGLPIDLRTGKPCAPDWKHPLQKRLAVEYRADEKSRVFVKAVSDCLAAGRSESEAAEVILWFQRVCGYMLLKHKREQIIVLNVGVGNNGKSTIMEAMLGYLGDSCSHIMDPDPLLQDFKGDPLTGFNSMVDKLMSLVEELPESKALSTSTLKRLSGGRKMEIRKRYEDNKVVRNMSLLWINSNVRPPFWDNTTGWRRRIVFLEWMMDFVEAVVKKDMPRDLEGDGSGWLNWALEGLQAYLTKGERRPACVTAGTQAYVEEAGDPLRTFYDRYFTKVEGATFP